MQRKIRAAFMRGGLASLSKVCIVEPSSREGTDIDYTFGQVRVTHGVLIQPSFYGTDDWKLLAALRA